MRTMIVLLLIAGCGADAMPTPTKTVCPTPDPNSITYDNFGQTFMVDYCVQCHASTLPRATRIDTSDRACVEPNCRPRLSV